MSVSDTTINTAADYTFELDVRNTVESGGKISVLFGTEFNFTPNVLKTCTAIYGFKNSAKCQIDATGRSIELTDAFPTTDFLLIFTIDSIINPPYEKNFSFLLSNYDSAGALVEFSGSTNFAFTTSPGPMTASITNLGSEVVAEYTDIEVSFTVTNEVADTGYFEFMMAKWNAGTQTVGRETSTMIYTVTDFNVSLQGYDVPCSSTSHPSLSCAFKPQSVSTKEQISQVRDILMVTGLDSVIAAGTTFTFQTSDSRFRNPPSTKSVSTFEADSHKLDGSVIDSQTVGISYQISEAATILANQVLIRAATGEINSEQVFDFAITMPLPLPVGAVIEMIIPTEVSIYSDSARTQQILNSAVGQSPLFGGPSVQILDEPTQRIKITNLVPSSTYYMDADNPIKFQLLNLKNPGSIQTTPEFQIAIYHEEDLILNVDQDGLTYTATPGILENVQIRPENYKTRQSVPYEISFETKNELFVGSDIELVIPTEIAVDGNDLTFTPLSSVSFTNIIPITWDEDTRRIIIDNAFDAALSPPVQVRFSIDTGLSNSYSTDPITPIIIRTLDSDGEIIDEGSSEAIEFSAAEIPDVIATACADVSTPSTTEEICTYRLKFVMGAEYPIVSGSSVKIELPDDLVIPDSDVTDADSYTDGIADITSIVRVGGEQGTIWVDGGFVQASAPNGIDWRQDSFSVYVAGIKTPRSTAPTLSFKVSINTSAGYVQYKKSQGIYSSVYQAKNFANVGLYRTSVANGDDEGKYIFTLEFASTIFYNEYVKITPPAEVEITPEGDQCAGIENITPFLSCTFSETSIYVGLIPEDINTKTQWDAGESVKFSITSIRNPLTWQLTKTFEIYVVTSTSEDYYVNEIEQGLSLTNTVAGKMSNVVLLPESNELGAKTSYQVYFTISNELPEGSSIQIQFPLDKYKDGLDDVSCAGIVTAGSSTSCRVLDNYENLLTSEEVLVVEVIDGFKSGAIRENTEIAILLTDVVNPKGSLDPSLESEQFNIATISPEGYPIDGAIGMQFEIGCVWPCKTCDGGADNCSSCLALDDGTPLNLDSTSIESVVDGERVTTTTSTCLAECKEGDFADKFNTCVECDKSKCATCVDSETFCTSCAPSNTIFLVDNTCTTCGDGTFAPIDGSSSCQKCGEGCSLCSSLTDCSTCDDGLFKFSIGESTECLINCPITALEWPGSVKECKACSQPCYTCEDSTETCSSCITGFYLHESTCLSECPSGYESDENQTCYRANETILPFITMIAPVVFLITVSISNAVDKRTRPITGFIALQSSFMIGFWVYQVIFLLKDGHNSSPMIIAFGLVANFILNCIFYEFLKTRILNKKDKLFLEHQKTYPRTVKQIINYSMFTSFQLFRFSYSGMCGKQRYMARYENHMKYYKRINRYTLFQITFVYMPIIAASVYNLWYTWYGRQVFWIDVECIIMGLIMCIMKIIVIIKTQKEYIKQVFDVGEFEGQEGKLASRNREKYLVDPLSKDLANDITLRGYRTEEHKKRIQGMNEDQRKGTLRAMFDRMFAKKQVQVEAQGFKMKHGRGFELNKDHFDENDQAGEQAYIAAGVSVPGYKSEMPKTKSKKMLYSSVGDEERRRANQIEEERKNLDYQQFNNNDATVTMNDMEGTLGATQVLDTIHQDTTPRDAKRYKKIVNETTQNDDVANPYAHEDQLVFGNDSARRMNVLKVKDADAAFDNIRRGSGDMSDANSDARYGITKEHYNFSSAPQNAKSALDGNRALQERFEQFQHELANKGVRQAHLMRTGEFKDIELAERHRYDSMPMVSQLIQTIEEDSDDAIENFDSAQYGKGTSKVIANHYNTAQQARKIEKADQKGGLNDNGSKNLTPKDFKDLIGVLGVCRDQKKQSKNQGAYIDIQRKELEVLVRAEKEGAEEISKMVKKLQDEIDAEARRLKEVEKKKKQDLAYVENAFYTSNEEGMGVSPNNYEDQNKMPRPGNRARSPPKDVPFGKNTEEDIHQNLDKISSPARFGAADTSFDNKVGAGLKGQKAVIKNGKLKHKALNADDDKYEYYTSEDEQGRRIQKMRKKKRKGGRSKDAKAKAGMGSSGQDFNKTGAGKAIATGAGNRARSLTTGTEVAIKSPVPLQVSSNMVDSARGRGQKQIDRSIQLRETGMSVMESNMQKQPRKRSKKKEPKVDYSGAYFKHTNFERAVIATNGRAPYNNKEVELITKPEGFDPNGYAFKNNWVNNLMKSGRKSPGGHASNVTGQVNESNGAHSAIPSASVTATTVFQGLGQADESFTNKSHIKPQLMNSDVTPASASFKALQNNLMNESPVTMMNMSDEKTGMFGIGVENVESRGGQMHGTEQSAADQAMVVADGSTGKRSKPPLPFSKTANLPPPQHFMQETTEQDGKGVDQESCIVDDYDIGSVSKFSAGAGGATATMDDKQSQEKEDQRVANEPSPNKLIQENKIEMM